MPELCCTVKRLTYLNRQVRQAAYWPSCLFACLPVGMENPLPADQSDHAPKCLSALWHDRSRDKQTGGPIAGMTDCMSAFPLACLFACSG